MCPTQVVTHLYVQTFGLNLGSFEAFLKSRTLPIEKSLFSQKLCLEIKLDPPLDFHNTGLFVLGMKIIDLKALNRAEAWKSSDFSFSLKLSPLALMLGIKFKVVCCYIKNWSFLIDIENQQVKLTWSFFTAFCRDWMAASIDWLHVQDRELYLIKIVIKHVVNGRTNFM